MLFLTVLAYTGLGLAGLIAAYAVYMLAVAVVPGFKVPEQPLGGSQQPTPRKEPGRPEPREDVSFEVNGTALSGWLYLPLKLPAPAPCIVMAHGLGATRAMGLHNYAVCFREAGFAVLAFDYRHLGKSGGEPRQLVWIPYQQQDYAAAIAYARSRGEIDPGRIALWGTSLSGGHVIAAAAKDPAIACACAQVPLLDGEAGGREVLKELGLGTVLRLTFGHALRDLVRSWLGLPPHRIPLVAPPGSLAVMASSGAYDTFSALAPPDFRNQICARILIRMDKYKPVRRIAALRCPLLLQICERDMATPPALVKRAAGLLGGRGEIKCYPLDHFDIYLGDNFDKSVSDQIVFYRKHLLGRG
jgi:fermentation-respiration switch protein FrsA (DUF1100 family)